MDKSEKKLLFFKTKKASASITFCHKVNLFTNHSNMARKVCMVKNINANILLIYAYGLSAKRIKKPFSIILVISIYFLFYIMFKTKVFCHIVASTMAIQSFETMRRYIDVSHLIRYTY